MNIFALYRKKRLRILMRGYKCLRNDHQLDLVAQLVDVLSKTDKANLAEVFKNMHKNWFAARSVATQNLVQNTHNELALAGIISGAHEKFTINGNKFSVSESGYYSVSADITSVYAGATE